VPSDAQTGAPAAEPRSGDHEHTPLVGLRVLVVDDEPDSRDVVRHILQREGAIVSTAASAAAALRMISIAAPDVLVSDVGMPYQDGYDLIRAIRRQESGAARLPALALTAYARPEDRDRAEAAGFQLHLTKPVVASTLVASIEQLASRGK